MLSRKLLLFLALIAGIFPFVSRGQDSTIRLPYPQVPSPIGAPFSCGTDLLLNAFRTSDTYRKTEEKMNRDLQGMVRMFSNDTVVLPVVFHVVAQDPFSIPDQELLDGLADLNDAFARRGAWAGSKGVDTKIRFCLARQDPEGGNTTGINRVPSYWGDHVNPAIEDSRLKATAQWDPSRYINIWYVRSINSEAYANFSCGRWTRAGVAGYATMPPGGGPIDGIVTSGFGFLLAHEMGHYLGLYHTFEGFCNNNNCTTDGDRVCDTPPDGSYRTSPCPSPENSCNTDTLSNYSNGHFTADVPDPIENIMDYGDPSCQNTLTQGQTDRMHGIINTSRKGLLQPKCEVPCTSNVYAGFKRSLLNIKAGDKVDFQNTSVGATSYTWYLDGVQVSTSDNYSYTFDKAGRFKVTLRAVLSNNCYSVFSENIIVNCGVVARFYLDKQAIASDEGLYPDSIRFINNSWGGNDFKWLVSNDKGMSEQVVSTQRDLLFLFAKPALYSIRMIASDGSCIDTSFTQRLRVEDPTADGVMYMNAIHCYQQTKIRLTFFVCNNGYDTLPAGTPISFYDGDPRKAGVKKVGTTFYLPDPLLGKCCGVMYTHIIDVGASGLNTLYAVLNDSGTSAIPFTMPVTGIVEKDYNNNFNVFSNFQFKVVPSPVSIALEPGDTLKLNASASPTTVSSFVWSPSGQLSCTTCRTPEYYADTSRSVTKMVKATSVYGCYDSAFVNIAVPPYHDFRIRIDEAECAGEDSIHVKFTVFNDFKRPVLPKGLTIRFYDGDPKQAGATWLQPAFILSDSIKAKEFSFTTSIFARNSGPLFAAVNDSIGNTPIVLPNTWIEEKNYNNNTHKFDYLRLKVTTTPLTGLIEPGDTILLRSNATPGKISSYTWWTDYNLHCPTCQNTDMLADTTTTKWVAAENMYGCRDTASLKIDIPPSDDFEVSILAAACSANDSMYVAFRVQNHFRRGVLPKGLTIRFYDND
ncbi:MAG TPA: M43 family zinc metalloprotease, partial [Phnomibacter sp.]|nr:M43 family zinc metalloprotease [Phnomibacter sp.]